MRLELVGGAVTPGAGPASTRLGSARPGSLLTVRHCQWSVRGSVEARLCACDRRRRNEIPPGQPPTFRLKLSKSRFLHGICGVQISCVAIIVEFLPSAAAICVFSPLAVTRTSIGDSARTLAVMAIASAAWRCGGQPAPARARCQTATVPPFVRRRKYTRNGTGPAPSRRPCLSCTGASCLSANMPSISVRIPRKEIPLGISCPRLSTVDLSAAGPISD